MKEERQEFLMPSLGADMVSGSVAEWLVKPGDRVREGDVIAVVDTDKALIEVGSFHTGVVEDLLVKVGERVPVGTALAVITGTATTATAAPGQATPATGTRAVRELDLGRRQDAMRQAIARAMARSNREIPHYHLATTVDMSAALAWLRERNRDLPVSRRILPAALLLAAAARAAGEVPQLNGFWVVDAFVPGEAVHLGVAIPLRGGGLIAPALHDAAGRGPEDLMAALRDLVNRARTGRLRDSEMTEATITVTNLGDQGVETVHGVIYPPQVALIGFGKILERPWAVDGLLGVRPLVNVTLAADHRATDGYTGGRFLTAVDRLLNRPEEL